MRRAVVDPQRVGSPAHVDAERPPGERRLEDPLSEIPGEEQAARPAPAEGRQKPQLRHADVLGLVDHAEVERWMRSLRHLHRKRANMPGSVRLPCSASADRTREKIDQSSSRGFSDNRVLRPSRCTSR